MCSQWSDWNASRRPSGQKDRLRAGLPFVLAELPEDEEVTMAEHVTEWICNGRPGPIDSYWLRAGDILCRCLNCGRSVDDWVMVGVLAAHRGETVAERGWQALVDTPEWEQELWCGVCHSCFPGLTQHDREALTRRLLADLAALESDRPVQRATAAQRRNDAQPDRAP